MSPRRTNLNKQARPALRHPVLVSQPDKAAEWRAKMAQEGTEEEESDE